LADQIMKAVRDLRLLARIVYTTGQRFAQAQALNTGFKQHCTAIGNFREVPPRIPSPIEFFC